MSKPEDEVTRRSGAAQDEIIENGMRIDIQAVMANPDRKPGTDQPMSATRPVSSDPIQPRKR